MSGTDRFSQNAARLAGLAGALFGWLPEEFWRATPAELGAVLEAMAGPQSDSASRSDLERLMQRFPD
jgi:uncharacterized phage protein (TIGR02216 family)